MAKKTEKQIAYKGFDLDWKCRGFQYELGKSYKHKGDVVACESGFHSCAHPLDVLRYYPPANSKFAVVEIGGETATHDSDTKIASAEITIKTELHLHDIIQSAVKYVFGNAKWLKRSTVSSERGASKTTGYSGAASATGYRGAASATGYRGAASATGESGAASATGTSGAASATGYRGAASATGYRGAATATGISGAAMACGKCGKVKASKGSAMFLCERDDEWNIINVWSGIAGQDGIKPGTWYRLENGNPVDVSND